MACLSRATRCRSGDDVDAGDARNGYLVVGAGATGLAFADEILRASKQARVVLVERRAKAGGHWNDAYPFVTLHQPALYYGVNSEPLGGGGGDLVSRQQILAYDERVIAKWTATGRLEFLPLCDFDAETGCVSSTVAPELDYEIRVRRKTVDTTYMNVTVPSTTPPGYDVAAEVPIVPINTLARLEKPWSNYVVVGGGKTGIDAILFLLDRGVEPDRIRWIVPNDAWFLNRASVMPDRLAEDLPAQLRCLRDSPDLESAIRRLEAEGRLLRLDPTVWPTKYRCATVNEEELAALRRIDDVVRMGRITRIDSSSIELTGGIVVAEPGSLYVDCTADGLARRPSRPISRATGSRCNRSRCANPSSARRPSRRSKARPVRRGQECALSSRSPPRTHAGLRRSGPDHDRETSTRWLGVDRCGCSAIACRSRITSDSQAIFASSGASPNGSAWTPDTSPR